MPSADVERKPAILYAAKSTEDTKGSIKTQLEDCHRQAEAEGYVVAFGYSDNAASAFKGNRGRGLEAAIAEARQLASERGSAALWVQHSDRLARGSGRRNEARHLGLIFFQLQEAGVELRSVQDDDNLRDAIRAVLIGERNYEDSKRKSEAVKAGMKRRREAGRHHGGPRPYGYRYEGGELVPEKAEAVVVRRIFADYVGGASQLAIARGLRADGIPTARGGEWHQGTVRGILANPLHAGLVGDDLVQGHHEPNVAPEVWKRAAQLRAAGTRTETRGRPPAGRHLFRKGALRCGECGAAMVPRTDRDRKGSPVETYRCYRRHQDGTEACSMAPVARSLIDGAVFRYFEKAGLDVDATRAQLEGERGRKLAEVRELLEQAETDAQKAEATLGRVRRDYGAGTIDAGFAAEMREMATEERAAAEAKAEQLRRSIAAIEADEELHDIEEAALRKLADLRAAVAGDINDAKSVDAVRAALMRLFEGFVYHAGTRRFSEGSEDRFRMLVNDAEAGFIELWMRPETIESYAINDGRLELVLRSEPLVHAIDNYNNGLTR